jgi:hypothetical protein
MLARRGPWSGLSGDDPVIERYREDGIGTVDMEAAGALAVIQINNG